MDYNIIQFVAATTSLVFIVSGSFIGDRARQALPDEMRLLYSDMMAKRRVFHILPGLVGIPLYYLAQYSFALSAEVSYGMLTGVFVLFIGHIHVATNRIIREQSLPRNFFFSKQTQFSLGYLGLVSFTTGMWLSAYAG